MRYITADYIIPISSAPIKEGVIVMDQQGQISDITSRESCGSVDLEKHSGIIIPGFINTHCHLELSHMKNLCATGTKLIPFITNVVKLRAFEQEVIQEAIIREDKNMWAAGIQAVGDISNKVDTAACKDASPISYYTFVEVFDMMQPTMTRSTVEQYRPVFTAQSDKGKNKKSFVPHAPYSVTPELFDWINRANPDGKTVSIHNQETQDEYDLFYDKSGGFEDFFKGFGMNLDHFESIGKSSMHYALEHMQPTRRTIFVHNTLTQKEDIAAAEAWSNNAYWATCPNANLYIENNLPNYQLFLDNNAKVTIGTDSIMSNWQLSIWEEIKTIQRYQSYVPISEMLRWATLNGAEALGYHKSMGSLEVGKTPGLVNIELAWQGDDTDISQSLPKRIV